jgi:F420-non-reducing hydrogenase iron-sulfur subunit
MSKAKFEGIAMSTFEPRIVVFACNWCSYAGADLAGVSRLQYPPNVRLIKTMCSGGVSPVFVLKAFLSGADGVIVTGCHIGDCHYINGNEKCEVSIEQTKEIMETLGMDPERLHLQWISAAEGQIFAETMIQFTEKIRSMGEFLPERKHAHKDAQKKDIAKRAS